MRTVVLATAVLAAAIVAGCDAGPAGRLTDTRGSPAARAAVPQGVAEPSPLVARKEAQASFDSARAALDLRRPNEAEADPALSDARVLADHLLRGGVPTRAEAKHVTRQLEGELRRLCAIIDVEARACAIEAVR